MMIRKTPTILVVEDDPESRAAMLKVLESADYKPMEADNGQQAMDMLLEENIDVMITDLRLPVMDGVELLKRAKAIDQEIEVILITGHGTVEVAVEAIKEGAYDFITKPVKKAQLLRAVEKAAEKQYLQRENKDLKSQLSQTGIRRLIYAGPEMRNIARMQARATALGVKLRPHVKTTKCRDIAEAQVAAGAQGITVSTLKEAEQFFACGLTDILYAVGMVPAKLPQVLALRRRGCDLKIITDNLDRKSTRLNSSHT